MQTFLVTTFFVASSRSGSGFLESAATEHVEDVDCPELGRIIQNKDLQMVYCRPKLKDLDSKNLQILCSRFPSQNKNLKVLKTRQKHSSGNKGR
jgi:hypothetical protein